MKVKEFVLLALPVMLLSACGSDEVTQVNNNQKVPLQVTSGILTRATGTQWQKDDAIGIFMLKAGSASISESAVNRRYTTSDGNTSFAATSDQTIYYPVDGSQVDFVAYYPQQTLTDDMMTLDVSSQSSLPAIDVMYAETASTTAAPLDKEHPQVAFSFSHRLTKLELTIAPGKGLQASDLKGLKVEITNQRTHGSYYPLIDGIDIAATPVQTVVLNTNAGGTASEAILLPSTAATGISPVVPGRELLFTLAATGEVFRWAIPDTKYFNQGDRNIYNITINRTGVDVTATISDWNSLNGGDVNAN
jgi:hypothetical protein